MKIPQCFGNYNAKDNQCRGNRRATEATHRKPCVLWYKCEAFKKHLIDHELDSELFFHVKGETLIPKAGARKFRELCDQLVKMMGRKVIPKKSKDKRKKGPTKNARIAASKALKEKFKKNRELMGQNFAIFRKYLQKKIPDREFVVSGEIKTPGQFYVVDKLKTSKYFTVYCCDTSKRDIPLIRLYSKTMSNSFLAELPIAVDSLQDTISKKLFSKLKPQENNRKNFETKILNVDNEKMAILAEVIALLIKKEKIKLPEIL